MNLEIKHFRVFVALATTLHFSRTAEKLNMAQPQLSRTLKFIEEEVGCPLLVRSTRNVALTPAGKVFLEQCQALLHQIDTVVKVTRDAAGGSFGRLNVAYMDFAMNQVLPYVLRKFHDNCPRINVELSHICTESQKSALLDGDVDVGFLIGPIENLDIDSVEVSRDPLTVVLPERHALAQLTSVYLSDLVDEQFIFGAWSTWRPYRSIIDHLCFEAGFLPHVVEEPYNTDAIFGLVAAELGVTIYPARTERLYPRGITVRPIADKNVEIQTVLAWNKHRKSPVLNQFITTVADLVNGNRPLKAAYRAGS